MLDETGFESLAASLFSRLANALEVADEQGIIELEEQSGIITLTLRTGKQYVISRHAPSRQVWVSSPISGGLHFSYNEAEEAWVLKDGREICALLAGELKQQGVDIAL